MAISPDGTLVALAGAGADYLARLFRIADGSLVATFGGFGGYQALNGLTSRPTAGVC